MKDTESTMKFEVLPNEILIECFEYLNVIEIFYSFDFLNYRFYKLIRNIPLHVNTQHIGSSALIPFCIKILNSQIKRQIISLKVSKTSTFDTIQTSFPLLSLNEFFRLRSLTLIGLNAETVEQISVIVPFLSNLRYFNFTSSRNAVDKILASLPACTVQTLMVPNLGFDLALTDRITSLVNLTILRCSVSELGEFFRYVPNLRYLRIENICPSYDSTIDQLRLIDTRAAHLKRLVINDYMDSFNFLEILLKKTSSLKVLIISCSTDMEIIDACRWEDLITASLPLLSIFKFKFTVESDDGNDIFDKFQNDFWHKQHHWYTEWVLDKDRKLIYTIPYISNEYKVGSYTKRNCNASMNKVNMFDNVTDLTLSIAAITDSCEYHFPNVKSLKLENEDADENGVYHFLKEQHIRFLNMIVNLCNLTHLDISPECKIESSSTLLQLLKEIPHMSSLKIDKNSLFPLFSNDELCKYFNKMIKKLDVTGCSFYASLKCNEIVKLCQIFSSMEQFRCTIGGPNNLQLVLNGLAKLSYMKVISYRAYYFGRRSSWLKDLASQLDLYSFTVECESYGYDNEDFYDSYNY